MLARVLLISIISSSSIAIVIIIC